MLLWNRLTIGRVVPNVSNVFRFLKIYIYITKNKKFIFLKKFNLIFEKYSKRFDSKTDPNGLSKNFASNHL